MYPQLPIVLTRVGSSSEVPGNRDSYHRRQKTPRLETWTPPVILERLFAKSQNWRQWGLALSQRSQFAQGEEEGGGKGEEKEGKEGKGRRAKGEEGQWRPQEGHCSLSACSGHPGADVFTPDLTDLDNQRRVTSDHVHLGDRALRVRELKLYSRAQIQTRSV